ncbi:ParA family protein (plasmid) [Shimia sp. W99]
MPDHLPPYLGLLPDSPSSEAVSAPAVLADLGPLPIDLNQPSTEASIPKLRLFSTWEICRYMLPIAVGHLRRVLREHPDLPQGRTDRNGRAKWFTLDEIGVLRDWFATNGRLRKSYQPYRPENACPQIISVAHMGQATGKTTVSAHLGMAAALDGYRVLLVDLDGQADLSNRFQMKAIEDNSTAQALLAHHCANHLQTANRNRLSRGDQPVSMPSMLADARDLDPTTLIQQTHWPGIDIIAASASLCAADAVMANWETIARGWSFWEALQSALRDPKMTTGYDLIVLDTPSSLGPLTVTGIAAADVLLVPTLACSAGLTMTNRYLSLLQTTLQDIEDRQNIAARALGETETRFSWDAFRLLLNRYDASSHAEATAAFHAQYGTALLPHWLPEIPLASTSGMAGLYEVDYRIPGREAWVQGRDVFDAVYADVKRILTILWKQKGRGLR